MGPQGASSLESSPLMGVSKKRIRTLERVSNSNTKVEYILLFSVDNRWLQSPRRLSSMNLGNVLIRFHFVGSEGYTGCKFAPAYSVPVAPTSAVTCHQL